MKEIIIEHRGSIIFLMLAMLLLFVLYFDAANTIKGYKAIDKSRFRRIESVSNYTDIVYDTETGVEYSTSYIKGRRSFQALLDADGKPLIYDRAR